MDSETGIMKIGEFVPNESNPRIIRDFRFDQLKRSLADFPEMLNVRPVVIDEQNVILGGNMRYHAAKDLGIEELPYKRVVGWTQEQKKEFVVKDNLNYGEWNHDELAANFEVLDLETWGVPLPVSGDIQVNLPGGVDAEMLGDSFELKDGDKPPFQSMTFTFSDSQAEAVKEAMKQTKASNAFKEAVSGFDNENSNGNALYYIISTWGKQKI